MQSINQLYYKTESDAERKLRINYEQKITSPVFERHLVDSSDEILTYTHTHVYAHIKFACIKYIVILSKNIYETY